MSSRGCDHFVADIRILIDRMRSKYEMNYAEVVGCLEIIKQGIFEEMKDEEDDSEEWKKA